MAETVEEVLGELADKQHRRRIYEELADVLLREYLGEDGEIMTVEDCQVPEVSKGSIRKVVQQLEEDIEQLEEDIDVLLEKEVS